MELSSITALPWNGAVMVLGILIMALITEIIR